MYMYIYMNFPISHFSLVPSPDNYSLKHIDSRPSGEEEINQFLQEGKLFQGGNAKWLHTLLSLRSGDRLMYVGDHVYADVLRSKRTLGWRTVLVVPELTNEIISHKKCKNIRGEILRLRRRQFSLQNEIDRLDDEWSGMNEKDGNFVGILYPSHSNNYPKNSDPVA